MKNLLVLVIIFVSLSCSENKETILSELSVNESTLYFESDSNIKELHIHSSGKWSVDQNLLDWCSIDKMYGENNQMVLISVNENTSDQPRQQTISIRSAEQVLQVIIHQEANKNEIIFKRLPIGMFHKIDWVLNQATGRIDYNFRATDLFVNNSIYDKIFLGNTIVCNMADVTELVDIPNLRISPITIGCFLNGKFYSEELPNISPSIYATFIDEILKINPTQNVSFHFSNTPVSYNSREELSLISKGNLGTDLNEIILGRLNNYSPQQDKKGLIYMSSQTLFNVFMDYPEVKPISASDEKLAYINNISYGIINLFIVESTKNATIDNSIIQKILKSESLSPQELLDSKDLIVYSFSFDKNNSPSVVEGGVELLETHKASNSISKERIQALEFSVNDLHDYSVSNLTYNIISEY